MSCRWINNYLKKFEKEYGQNDALKDYDPDSIDVTYRDILPTKEIPDNRMEPQYSALELDQTSEACKRYRRMGALAKKERHSRFTRNFLWRLLGAEVLRKTDRPTHKLILHKAAKQAKLLKCKEAELARSLELCRNENAEYKARVADLLEELRGELRKH
uniref:Uncharacterized protein n=1 Tax=Anopheles melas TaxID=34690 RepID=A0A182TPT8_9DIPT